MPGSSEITFTFRSRRRTAFSLVEMLAVMGIIAVLLLATLPAMRGLSDSGSRRGAVGNMMAVLDRARMMAISDGLCTYVVFASKPAAGGTSSGSVNAALWGHAYAIYEDSDNVSFIPVQKTPWMFLPRGVAFKVTEDVTATAASNAPAHSILTCFAITPPQTTDPSFPLSTASGSGSVQLPYWKFDSTGIATVPASIQSPQKPSDYMKLLMFPGFINADGTEVSTQNTTGAGNKQPAQLEEIDVNPVTGPAKYITDPTNNLSTPSST